MHWSLVCVCVCVCVCVSISNTYLGSHVYSTGVSGDPDRKACRHCTVQAKHYRASLIREVTRSMCRVMDVGSVWSLTAPTHHPHPHRHPPPQNSRSASLPFFFSGAMTRSRSDCCSLWNPAWRWRRTCSQHKARWHITSSIVMVWKLWFYVPCFPCPRGAHWQVLLWCGDEILPWLPTGRGQRTSRARCVARAGVAACEHIQCCLGCVCVCVWCGVVWCGWGWGYISCSMFLC